MNWSISSFSSFEPNAAAMWRVFSAVSSFCPQPHSGRAHSRVRNRMAYFFMAQLLSFVALAAWAMASL